MKRSFGPVRGIDINGIVMIKFFIHVHRLLGVLLCILCFSWCISGIVLIYHGYPRVGPDKSLPRQEALDCAQLPSMQEVWQRLPKDVLGKNLTLNNPYGRPVFHYGRWRDIEDVYMDPAYVLPDNTYPLCEEHARLWCPDHHIVKVDTMHKLDVWIPFGQLKRDLPVYAFYYDGPEHYRLYVSSRTGDILHFSSREQRFWAWIGAIPHWLYITSIRQDMQSWNALLYWSTLVSMIMCVAGAFLGVRAYWLNRRKGLLRSPYKKQWFRWHHITGFFFGIFLFTWLFSAWAPMSSTFSSLFKQQKGKDMASRPQVSDRGALPAEAYRLDYRAAIASIAKEHGEVKEISWGNYQDIPLYKVRTVDEIYTLDASADSVCPFRITEEMVYAAAKKLAGDTVQYTISRMDEYDNYYISRRKGRLPLPAYKVTMETENNDVYYFNLESEKPQHYDDNGRWRRWAFRGLHRLDFKFLLDRPVLWTVVMWTLLLGCAFVSLSGIVLFVKYIIRLIRRPRKCKG